MRQDVEYGDIYELYIEEYHIRDIVSDAEWVHFHSLNSRKATKYSSGQGKVT